MIDWDFALATAKQLTPSGPELSTAEAEEVVAELREAAVTAEAPVRELTGLVATEAPVLVVDRERWAQGSIGTFEKMSAPLLGKLPAHLGGKVGRAVGEKVAGAEVGVLLAFLSSRILGQFDPFAGDAGRLLLVAPNIVKIGNDLEVDAHDFRQWVCLHEETHRAQFTGVPWMRGHFEDLVNRVITGAEPGAVEFSDLVDKLPEVVRIAKGDSDATIAELFNTPEQREAVDKITGLMSLLEGHADVVMDEVGPQVVPTVAQIRRRFEHRRASGQGMTVVVRRLLGMEAKMRQYRDGALFVRGVTERVGDKGFADVWAMADNLPSRAEILDPGAWVSRVHG